MFKNFWSSIWTLSSRSFISFNHKKLISNQNNLKNRIKHIVYLDTVQECIASFEGILSSDTSESITLTLTTYALDFACFKYGKLFQSRKPRNLKRTVGRENQNKSNKFFLGSREKEQSKILSGEPKQTKILARRSKISRKLWPRSYFTAKNQAFSLTSMTSALNTAFEMCINLIILDFPRFFMLFCFY